MMAPRQNGSTDPKTPEAPPGNAGGPEMSMVDITQGETSQTVLHQQSGLQQQIEAAGTAAQQQTEYKAASVRVVADPNSWQTKSKAVSGRLGKLLALELWYDCELLIGQAAIPFQAHRVILASASPVLASMLYDNSEQSPSLPNIEREIFKNLLEYIYTDIISINSCENACHLYQAARLLILPHLEEECKAYLLNNVSLECVLWVYEFVETLNDAEVMDKCLKLMSEEAEALLQSTRVEGVHAETLERIFSLPCLKISSELVLCKTAERWVRARSSLNYPQQISKEIGDTTLQKQTHRDTNKEKAKARIRGAIKQIRFLTLKPEEFATYNLSSLLNESDLLALSLNLHCSSTYKTMPDGFSLARNLRCTMPEKSIPVPSTDTTNCHSYTIKITEKSFKNNIAIFELEKFADFDLEYDLHEDIEYGCLQWHLCIEKRSSDSCEEEMVVSLECAYCGSENAKSSMFKVPVEVTAVCDTVGIPYHWKEDITYCCKFLYTFSPTMELNTGYNHISFNVVIKKVVYLDHIVLI